MRGFVPVLVFVLLIMSIAIAVSFKKPKIEDRFKGYKIINYKLQTNSYKLLVADTAEKWSRGLMFVTELEGTDGMIFLFPDKAIRTFWNKNTLIDLDLYWIDGDTVVGKSLLPSIEKSKEIVTVESPKPVNKVVEFPK